MTDDGPDAWAAWADVGRRLDALAEELTGYGFSVSVRWDRPHGHVVLVVRGDEPADDGPRKARGVYNGPDAGSWRAGWPPR